RCYSSWRSCGERNRRDAVFEGSVRHFSDCFIRSRTISLDNDRLVLALGCIEQWAKLLHGDPLVLKINRGNCPARNTDNLLIALGTERKTRERHRDVESLLQDEIRPHQQKKSEQESEIDQPNQQKPPEVIVCCSTEFHS